MEEYFSNGAIRESFRRAEQNLENCNLTEMLDKTNSLVRRSILALELIHMYTDLHAYRECTWLYVTPNSQGCILLYDHTCKMRLGV